MITPYRTDMRPPDTAGPYIGSSTRSVLPHVEHISGAHSRIVELVSCSVSSSKSGLPLAEAHDSDVFALGSGGLSSTGEIGGEQYSPAVSRQMLTSPGLAGKLGGSPGDIFEREEEDNYPS